MDKFETVKDFEKEAKQRLTAENFIYYSCGVGEELTLEENCAAYRRWRFRPRLLQNVSKVDISTSVCGDKIAFPICISPTAFHKKAHPLGEVATAKAAASFGIGFTLSAFAHQSMEEVARLAPNCLRWCNFQIVPDYNFMEHFVRRAERNGFRALVLTIDQPHLAYRSHRKMKPDGRADGEFPTENLYLSTKHLDPDSEGMDTYLDMWDGSATWDGITWLKSITSLKIIVKGVLTGEMAAKAVEYGVDGILVSNHGGRQIDGVFSTIDSLPEVVKSVNGRCEVYVDGGIRRGSDIAKAIALGAKVVFVGRPVLWGLACGGEEGVKRILEILRKEFLLTMRLLGVRCIEELQGTPKIVVHENEKFSRL